MPGVEKISIDNVLPGMKIAAAIEDRAGRMWLPAGTTLTVKIIDRLTELGFASVVVETREVPRKAETTYIISKENVDRSAKAWDRLTDSVAREKRLDVAPVRDLVSGLLEEIEEHPYVTLDLRALRTVDRYTYFHSLNVTVLALATGAGMGVSRDQLSQLGEAAMLHDIGKIDVGEAIVAKAGPLTSDEWATMQKHPAFARDRLLQQGGVSPDVIGMVYQHHERLDGSGYPAGICGPDFNPMARILAAADIYDAMTADRVYRPHTPPAEALEWLTVSGSNVLSPAAVDALVKRLVVYPVGSRVKLTDGRWGRIVAFDTSLPHRPEVLLDNGERVDLVFKPALGIAVCEYPSQ
jgi:HD-GYP domain-containing protein (c-di-GMP phosphodiesterase class II)